MLGVIGWQQFASSPTPPATISITASTTTVLGVQTTATVTQTDLQQDLIVIDTHAHLQWDSRSGGSSDLAARTALGIMDRVGVRKTLIMPPPFPPDFSRTYDQTELAEVVEKYPERFAVLAGGGSLNPMIHSIRPEEVAPDIRDSFEQIAVSVINGGAVGFGELTAEHFSLDTGHPYISSSPDHPLFLLLADIAGRRNVPIDIHMEAVPQDMPFPEELSGPPNPATLSENIAAFERLLSYNSDAHIIWAHAGWDNTGYRTVALMRQLLQRHPNLYMSIKIQRSLHPENAPLNEKGEIRSEWMDLLRSFPDRFLIGSDIFYGVAGEVARGTTTGGLQLGEEPIWVFLKKLPPDLARKIAYENVVRIYSMKMNSQCYLLFLLLRIMSPARQ